MSIRWLLPALLLVTLARGSTIYVSVAGNDHDAGTKSQPFATLGRARDEIRNHPEKRPITVIVHRGIYRQTATLDLDMRDSESHWQAAQKEEVRVDGGLRIDPRMLQPVRDKAILDRLPAAAREHTLVADLSLLGVPPIANWPLKFRGAPEMPEFFFNDKRMQIARWPNQGWTAIKKVIDPGADPRDGDTSNRLPIFTCADSRPKTWNTDAGIWLVGNWTYNWYDEVIRVKSIDHGNGQITLAAPALYSVKSGRFYAMNVLEELDEPGEYYIDTTNRRLYFWPPAPIENAEIALSTLNAPLLRIVDGHKISFSGIIFENSLADAIEVKGGTNISIEGSTVRNVRGLGIRINGGSDHLVHSCEIYDTGAGGLCLEGGDRRTLTPAHQVASNNRIHDFSRLQGTGAYGITLAGVGNSAAHNLIYNAPHQAVFIAGNDNVVEYNIITNVVNDSADAGAIYKGRDPSCRGNLIRYNFFRDIGHAGKWTCAIYFDDGDGGDSVIGNIFLHCLGGNNFGAVFSHGGFDIRAENNIFIDCERALGSTPWSYSIWLGALNDPQDFYWPTKLLKDVDITSSVYTNHYPELLGFMHPTPNTPRENHARNNVMVRCGQISGGNWKCDAATTWSTNADPGFVNAVHEDFRQRPDAELFRRLPGFNAIPFGEIGPKPRQ